MVNVYPRLLEIVSSKYCETVREVFIKRIPSINPQYLTHGSNTHMSHPRLECGYGQRLPSVAGKIGFQTYCERMREVLIYRVPNINPLYLTHG